MHLALPATLSSAAAGEVAAALAPLAPTHVALTHSDETARPGAPLELALARRPSALVRVLARGRHAGRPRPRSRNNCFHDGCSVRIRTHAPAGAST